MRVFLPPGRILHVHPADAHHRAAPGIHPEPDDGVHAPVQPLLQTVCRPKHHLVTTLI